MNSLAEIAVLSIDSVASNVSLAESCYNYSLCEYNKYAELQKDERNIWIPVWR